MLNAIFVLGEHADARARVRGPPACENCLDEHANYRVKQRERCERALAHIATIIERTLLLLLLILFLFIVDFQGLREKTRLGTKAKVL